MSSDSTIFVKFSDRKELAQIAPATDYPLLPGQVPAVRFLRKSKRCLLVGRPGTGKTLMAANAARDLGVRRVLILTPSVGLYNWMKHSQIVVRHANVLVVRNSRPSDDIIDAIRSDVRQVVIVPYSVLCRMDGDVLDALATLDLVIADESHVVKSVLSKTSQAFYYMARKMFSAWLMTGTPVTRYYDDLYAPLSFIDRPRLTKIGAGTYEQFVNKFCLTKYVRVSKSRVKQETCGNRNPAKLKSLVYGDGPDDPTAPAFYLPLSAVNADMPKLIERDITIDAPENYDSLQLIKKYLDAIELPLEHRSAHAERAMLNQIRTHIGFDKVNSAVEHISELLLEEEGRGVLVFAFNLGVIESIENKLKDHSHVRLAVITGATSAQDRSAVESDFNSGKLNVTLCQIQAGGVALNMQENCSNVVFVQRDWSDEINMQALQRVWRLGQTRQVTVDYLVSANHAGLDMIPVNVNAKKREGTGGLHG